ncbi:hypothetical protein ENSA5_65130 [Enhygromyxa salina]|uniref:PIN domain-containing protein n=1 Tax=Enhygromyxa salina TaxID=215803 RepID=A0A2S9XCL3_9BACT|nr:hypothetical protein [Enhygromyxa salina]PRP90421.1 hypothetical protein ENSA5_65130 [Enhygromyxa salina]
MTIVLIDADAFLSARRLGVVELLVSNAGTWPKPTLRCTAIIGRNELNDVQDDVARLEALGLLEIVPVYAKTPEARKKRELQEKLRVHKGEAEAIAWGALRVRQASERVIFVSHDSAARRAASKSSLESWDLFDLAKHWLDQGWLDIKRFKAVFESWEEDPKTLGRPQNFSSVEETFRKRFGTTLDAWIASPDDV